MPTKKASKMNVSVKEIRELLRLRGWSQAELARQLGLDPSAVCLWLSSDRKQMPRGPASILMRQWLEAAREEARKETVTA
jgi:transcriptional regulator with XRE-family HTH domain